MDVDPAASMRCWAVEVQLGGRLFEVPPLPAADWWPVLTSGNLGIILDFLPSTDSDAIDEMLLAGELDTTALTDAVEVAAGRSLHAAIVLAVVAKQNWAVISGRLAQRGFRWDMMPLGAALDAIYAMAVENMTEENRAKFEALLDAAPAGLGRKRRRGPRDVEKFEEIAGPKPTTGVRASGAPSGSSRPRTRPRPRPPRRAARSTGPT